MHPRLLVLLFCLICGGLTAVESKQDQLRQQYQQALATLAEDDDAGHQKLAQWCAGKKLTAEAEQLWAQLVQRKRDRLAAKPDLAGYQALVAWCTAQGLKKAAEEVRRDQLRCDHQLRRAKLAADDAKGLAELGRWCQKNLLAAEAIEVWQAVLALRPDDTQARKQIDGIRAALWAEAPTGLLKRQTVPGWSQETAWYHVAVPGAARTAKDGLPLIIFLHGGTTTPVPPTTSSRSPRSSPPSSRRSSSSPTI